MTDTDGIDTSAQLTRSVDLGPSEQVIESLRKQLAAHNIQQAHIDESQGLAVFVHNAHNQLVGGVMGNI